MALQSLGASTGLSSAWARENMRRIRTSGHIYERPRRIGKANKQFHKNWQVSWEQEDPQQQIKIFLYFQSLQMRSRPANFCEDSCHFLIF